jgi:hypothetical protein
MDVAAAMKSGMFEIVKCECGKCKGDEHVVLVFKTTILMNIQGKDVQSFCSTTAAYVKVALAYRCNMKTRSVLAWCEVRNPANELVLRSEPHSLPQILAPATEAGEGKLLLLLGVRRALLGAAMRKRAA